MSSTHCSLLRTSLLAGGLALLAGSPAFAVEVIVRVMDGKNPATVAARHRIVPERLFRQVDNSFTANITSAEIAALDDDKDVQHVIADRVISRLIPARQSPKWLRGRFNAGEPYVPPPQPPQRISSEVLRVNAHKSATARINGRDDRRIDADIAVIDSGVDPFHPDLNVVGGFDCVRRPAAERGWYDRLGHGTFVAGMAAALDNGIGLVGVAPGARIWSVAVIDDEGYVSLAAFMCSLEYVLLNRRIEVVNMSLVFPSDGQVLPCKLPNPARLFKRQFGQRPDVDIFHEFLCRLDERGVTLVAGAGNDNIDAFGAAPAQYPEVLAVSAIIDFDGKPGGKGRPGPECYPEDKDDTFAFFSNWGTTVDISAPGVCNESTVPGGEYGVAEGTSFAAPMVAGAAALLYAKHPGISPERVGAIIRNRAQRGTITQDPDGIDEGVLDASTF